jgi:GAF domain-containing protein
MRATRFDCDDSLRVLIAYEDITERKRVEDALAWEASVHAAMAELSKALIRSVSLDDIAYLVLENARGLTGSRFGYVGYIDPESGYFISPTLTRDIWDICEVREKDIVFQEFRGLWGWVLEQRAPLVANEPADDPRASGTPQGHIPIERVLSVPALIGEELVGQISVANPDRDYTKQDLAVVEYLASLYALAVQEKRSEKALAETTQLLETILDHTHLGLDPDDFAGLPLAEVFAEQTPIVRVLEGLSRRRSFV